MIKFSDVKIYHSLPLFRIVKRIFTFNPSLWFEPQPQSQEKINNKSLKAEFGVKFQLNNNGKIYMIVKSFQNGLFYNVCLEKSSDDGRRRP